MTGREVRRLWILALGMVLTGCGMAPAGGNEGRTVTSLHADAFCGTSQAAVRWLDSRRAVLQALGRRRTDRDGVHSAVRELDFERDAVVEISLGERPSAGYAVTLADTAAAVEHHALHLSVRVTSPAPDAMAAQVVTSPCLMVVVPRGNYRRVEVTDVDGTAMGTAALP